jgi:ribosomal protein S18 acetylase RimI-like enzyme
VTTVEDILAHHGIKGMKWGVRKNDGGGSGGKTAKTPKGDLVLQEKVKSGDTISIYKKPPPPIAKFFSRFSDSYAKDVKAFAAFSMHDQNGAKVGDAAFVRESKTSLHLDWIGVKNQHRGKGYASAALAGVIKYSQNEGITKLTLEVPSNAPDARHIYEKMGFKGGKTVVDKDDPVFGGLTPMSMDVPKKSVKHAENLDQWEQDFIDGFADFLIKHFSNQPELKHMTTVEKVLAHYGVKGMKWGQRKKNNPASADAAAATKTRIAAKKQGLHTVSNADIQAAIRRMQLEQDFKRLSVNEKSAVTRWVSSTLLEIGKREVQQRVAKKVATTVIKKAATGGAA